jgi:hypothetical protein
MAAKIKKAKGRNEEKKAIQERNLALIERHDGMNSNHGFPLRPPRPPFAGFALELFRSN